VSVGHLVILRYLTREILETAGAVALVLLLVVLSGRFIQFLEKAAAGELSIELMLTMILWRVPSSLELILPLALTLSVLLVLGRMNQDSELTILRAAGYSNPANLWSGAGPRGSHCIGGCLAVAGPFTRGGPRAR